MAIHVAYALAIFNLTSMRGGRLLLALYALHLGAQPFTVGLLTAMFSVAPMLLAIQAGKLADRFGSRWPLMFGALGGACGMVVPLFSPSVPALFVAAAMNGLSFAFYNVSLQNVVGLTSTAENRAVHFSNYALVLAVTSFVGPVIAGFSIDHGGHAVALVLLTGMSLIAFVILLIWGTRLPKVTLVASRKKGAGHKEEAGGGGHEGLLHTFRRLWPVLATSSLLTAGYDLFQFYMPIYCHNIGLSASTIGIILATFAAATFVVRLLMPRLLSRMGELELLAYAFFLGALCIAVIPFFGNAIVLMLLAFVLGLGMGCGQPIIMALTFGGGAKGRSGEALGLRVTANHLTHVVTPVVFGSVASAFGLMPTFWLNALMLATGGTITRLRSPGDRKRA